MGIKLQIPQVLLLFPNERDKTSFFTIFHNNSKSGSSDMDSIGEFNKWGSDK